ncbi:3-isopropylmalate dehydratase large subunit [Marinicella sp. S1101]|uniref:3-isopropylmalate dehydratase large subunit n=1 Tax=Marinicella marina TaxID=2996016 RepID=UPI002260F5E8|nr:3-isopropylmalate dehydratase large subunit [Marinicella marina]MCX7552759.1 3-isopropylmalate dehydratase large subunit [Marinicella marina]MDJ1139932.1 3-isopropylmalate dehydratase large subunit [Marinicella marina]
MPDNIVEKIWQQHLIKQQNGFPDILGIDFALLHEVTSAQAFDMLDDKNLGVYDSSKFLATIDHSIPTRTNRHEIHDPTAKAQIELLRKNCAKHNIPICDLDSTRQGIVHVVGPEMGVTQPGMTLVCGDSHTATHGAFGALAFGIGTSTLAHVFATGAILMNQPKVMQVAFTGELPNGTYAKDMIMHLIAEIGIGGATQHVIEYTGAAVRALSMEQRMTLCNMSIECGAIAGLIAPDQTTFDYIKDRPYAPQGPLFAQAVEYWQSLCSEPDCSYDSTIELNIAELKPMISWGTNPQQAIQSHQKTPDEHNAAMDYVKLNTNQKLIGTPIQWAFIGSCTNGRIEDLRIVADILRDRKIATAVTMYVVPGSEQVMLQAKAEGLDQIFETAGAEFRLPGCSMCLGMNDDKVPAGARCISTTNRNFIGRQGTGSITHLASPATVAYSALAGFICTEFIQHEAS